MNENSLNLPGTPLLCVDIGTRKVLKNWPKLDE